MIKPKPGQVLPTSPHSRIKILFICDCGNKKWISWKNFNSDHTRSCGSCKNKIKYNLDIRGKKFGYLELDSKPVQEIQIRTSQGYHRVYDLGKTKWELILE